MNKTQIAISIIILCVVGMGFMYDRIKEALEPDPKIKKYIERTERDGEVKQFTSSGKLKTIINYTKGVKNGMSYLYYDDGRTVLLALPYVDGLREGVSKKYYESGDLYAETSYHNDTLDGPRKVYYRSGQLKSVVNYQAGIAGIGTEEYLMDGTRKKNFVIKYEQRGNLIWLSITPVSKLV